MPIYEYACNSCEKVIEVMQKFSDAPLADCPECGKPVQKIISMSSFALKGAGWYTTDYKRGSSMSKPAKSGAASGTSSGASAAASDAPAKADSGHSCGLGCSH